MGKTYTELAAEFDLQERCALFAIDEDTQAVLGRIGEILAPHTDRLTTVYYDHFLRFSKLDMPADARVVTEAKTAEYSRLKFTPPLDRGWLERAVKMGYLNHMIGALNEHTMGALSAVNRELAGILVRASRNPKEALSLVDHFTRVVNLEAEVMSSAMRAFREQQIMDNRETQIDRFRADIADVLNAASAKSRSARQQSESAEEITATLLSRAAEVAAAADQSATAMREAAETSTGLIRAIEETRTEVDGATDVVDRATDQANEAVETASILADHTKAVESIVSLIRDIAGQTNLLALNATIEAARAGDAGRGFAVVASEVKSLAGQTARATDDIARKIADIQTSSKKAVEANRSILSTVDGVRGSAERIRDAMDRQSATVTMITGSVDETAISADSMSESIATIRETAESIANDLRRAAAASGDVDERIGNLDQSAKDFLEAFAA
ncbi:MAG: globin-coupled sensor protein [Pacificimonas sp.]|jgi:methyl-accepting chemotaxis protein|nr:globin-coupled sensor protein [Pacificimonas sp.]